MKLYNIIGKILPLSNAKPNIAQKKIRAFLAKMAVAYAGRDINIEKGAVICAGAVVAKDIPEYAIVIGNPVKVIGYRE